MRMDNMKQTSDLLAAYTSAFVQLTPPATPANVGIDALCELLAALIASQPNFCIPVALEVCRQKVEESVTARQAAKKGYH